MRFSILLPLAYLFLASCGGQTSGDSSGAVASAPPAGGNASNSTTTPAPAVTASLIDCRPAEASAFTHDCTVETSGQILIVRKANGGFRRLLVTTDGTGVAAADGSEPAHVSILADQRIEVEIGGDRFRLPARVQAR